MPTSPKARALEVCMQQILMGTSLEQALAPYPQWAEELRPRLEAAQAARAYGAAIRVPADGLDRSRAIFLEAANQRVQTHGGLFAVPTWRWGLAVLALALILFLGVRTVAATAEALPGDLLYPVKIAGEQTRLLLSASPAQRLDLEQSYDQTRRFEVEALIQRSRRSGPAASPQVTFTGALTQMKADGWMVGGIPVLISSDTQFIGEVQVGFFLEVQGALQPGGRVLAQKIRARELEFSGRVEAMNGEQWVVSGVSFQVTHKTLVQGQPALGSQVQVRAIQVQDASGQAVLWARLIETGEAGLTPTRSEVTNTTQAQPSATAGPGQEIRPGATSAEDTLQPDPLESPTGIQEPRQAATASPASSEPVLRTAVKEPEDTQTPGLQQVEPAGTPKSTETAEPVQSAEPDEHTPQSTANPTENQN